MIDLLKLEEYNLTTEEIAKKLGYHPQYVRFLASSGKLPALKRGRAWRFSEKEITEYLTKGANTYGKTGDPAGDSLLQ